MENSNKLLFISLDNVATQDVEYLRELPNFSAVCQRGTLVTEVDSVFISNTYPAHTSMITGCLPKDHGIPDNKVFSKRKPSRHGALMPERLRCLPYMGKRKQKGKPSALFCTL